MPEGAIGGVHPLQHAGTVGEEGEMKHEDPQGPNLMVSRNGASENPLQKCAQCSHLYQVGTYLCCDQLVTPGGYPMPWGDGNHACGLFVERRLATGAGRCES